MVTTQLHSGLGNQLFMVSAAIGLAEKYDSEALFNDPKPGFHKFLPNLPKLDSRQRIKHIFKEKGHHYQEIPFQEDMQLEGFFQTECYFKHCKEKILNMVNSHMPIIDQPMIHKTSIHVRRGDYADNPSWFVILPLDYYLDLLDINTEYLVFSDDYDWCKKEFAPYTNVEIANNKGAKMDMAAIARCEHNIIANSSFSWWGAWLNQNPNKKVVAPKTWFGPGLQHLDLSDLIPKTWEII